MAKLQSSFEMTYHLKKKVVRNLKIVTDLLPLTITGVYYCDTNFPKLDVQNRYDLDIETALFEGKDIKAVLEFTDVLDGIMDEIIRYAPNYFTEKVAS